MSTWICDIDGTLALRAVLGRGPFDWERVGEDLPNPPVVEIVLALAGEGHRIIYLSGRMEQCRRQTELWLDANAWLMQDTELHMRADGDMRPDNVVKREIYEQEIAPHHTVMGVIDDRDKVVRMWREELGLTCIQVAPGNF